MRIPSPALLRSSLFSCLLCTSVWASAAAPPTPSPAPTAAKPSPRATGTPAAAAKPSAGAAAKPTPTPKRLKGVRGVLKELKPGKSITIVAEKTGEPLTVALSPKAALPPGLKPGDAIRILADVGVKPPVVEKVVRLYVD